MKKFTMIMSLVCCLISFSALADLNLDQARSERLVEEMPTGYIKAASSVAREKSAEVEAFVKKINSERTKAYEKIAADTKSTPEHVAAQAAKKIQEKLGK